MNQLPLFPLLETILELFPPYARCARCAKRTCTCAATARTFTRAYWYPSSAEEKVSYPESGDKDQDRNKNQ